MGTQGTPRCGEMKGSVGRESREGEGDGEGGCIYRGVDGTRCKKFNDVNVVIFVIRDMTTVCVIFI